MGVNVWNLNVECDHAPESNYSTIELHMEFPIPHADLEKVGNWLRKDDWDSTKDYLIGKYPEKKDIFPSWRQGSVAFPEAEFCSKLAVVGKQK